MGETMPILPEPRLVTLWTPECRQSFRLRTCPLLDGRRRGKVDVFKRSTSEGLVGTTPYLALTSKEENSSSGAISWANGTTRFLGSCAASWANGATIHLPPCSSAVSNASSMWASGATLCFLPCQRAVPRASSWWANGATPGSVSSTRASGAALCATSTSWTTYAAFNGTNAGPMASSSFAQQRTRLSKSSL